MFSTRATSWMPIAGMLALVAGALGWLLIGFGGAPESVRPLRDVPGARVEFYAGDGKAVTVDEVRRFPETAWQSMRADRERLYIPRGGALWARLTVPNRTPATIRGVLTHADYFVDRAEAWWWDGELDGLRHSIGGEAIPVQERSWWGRDTALPVTVPAGGATVVYVRAEDFMPSSFFFVWWPDQAEFASAQARGLLAEGIYFGVLFALLGYNLMLWLRLRLPDIGYYLLYLSAAAGFMVMARGLPALGGWKLASPALEACLSAAMALNGFFLTQFARVFMEFKQRRPLADLLAQGLMGLQFAATLGSLSGLWWQPLEWLRVGVLATGVTHVALFGLAVWMWRTGARQSRFFLAAFGCLFAASLPVTWLWLTMPTFGNAPVMYLMIGSALEMLLLSLATADRFAQAQRDKVIAQQKLVEETEQRRAIQEAYADELAVEVRERTKELEAANADKDRIIAVIGHDLRSPLTSLMQTAEQLALTPEDGPAFKKYAADAALVGRQTLLLIEDLVLWARLRAGLRSPPGRHAARALVAPVIALHRTFAGQRGVALVVDVPESLRLSTDLVLAQTLLRNLVANALKFARTCVEVCATEEPDGVRLTVRDDGPGLPAAVRAALAKEFPEPADAESGLGLRLCLEIGRALAVKIEIASTSTGGTEFQFKFPR